MAESGFEVKITQADGGEILLRKNMIDSVEFIIDTIEENAKDRSENIVNKVTVIGTITDESKEATKELLLWSMANASEEIYRSAEITIRINDTKRVRKYTMDKVFCIDYIEKFNRGGGNSTFTLTFSQRKDNFEGINVIC